MYLTECHQFNYDNFIYIEAYILSELDYNIHFITPYDILLHFCCQGLIYSSDWILASEGGFHKPNNECAKVVTQNAKSLCMQISLNHHFLKYDSFSLVCGIIMSSRNLVRMKEDWPDELYLMTNLMKCGKQVIHIRDDILNFFNCAPKHNKSFNNETAEYRGSTNQKLKSRSTAAKTNDDLTTQKIGKRLETPGTTDLITPDKYSKPST
jgi:hypothetical protein